MITRYAVGQVYPVRLDELGDRFRRYRLRASQTVQAMVGPISENEPIPIVPLGQSGPLVGRLFSKQSFRAVSFCVLLSGCVRLVRTVSGSRFDSPRRMRQHSPRAFPLGEAPPVALASVRERTAVRPVGGARARESACAKNVGASINRGLGTNVTVRIQNACGRSTAGKPPSARPNIAPTRPLEATTPRQKESAVNERGVRPRPLKFQTLHPRVVTHLKLFFPSPMRPAGLLPTPHEFPSQPGTVLLRRVPPSGPQRPRP